MPNFELLAEAFGVKGMVVKDRSQLDQAIGEMLKHDGPVVMDIHVTKDENCYPMIAPGSTNAQMLGLPKDKPYQGLDMVTCNNCGSTNNISNKFCSECGIKL